MTEHNRISNFQSDWHTLYCGWVLAKATLHGLPVTPVVDEDGNYLPELQLALPRLAGHEEEITVTLVIPPPPDGWELP